MDKQITFDEKLKKDLEPIVDNAYACSVDTFLKEFQCEDIKDVKKWIEEEIYFYTRDSESSQYELKEENPKAWREDVKRLKSFLKKYCN